MCLVVYGTDTIHQEERRFMPHNPAMSKQVAAYVDLSLFKRMTRVAKKHRRYSISRQIEFALAAHIGALETHVGIKEKL